MILLLANIIIVNMTFLFDINLEDLSSTVNSSESFWRVIFTRLLVVAIDIVTLVGSVDSCSDLSSSLGWSDLLSSLITEIRQIGHVCVCSDGFIKNAYIEKFAAQVGHSSVIGTEVIHHIDATRITPDYKLTSE